MVGQTVVVGIDGSPISRRVLVEAADEAHRLGISLTIVHAAGRGPEDGCLGDDHALLAAARSWTQQRRPDVGTSVHLVHAGAVGSLVMWSQQARTLVIGSTGHSTLTEKLIGSTTAEVIGQSACPVLVVAPSDTTEHGTLGAGAVVVGTDLPVGDPAVLRTAFDEAASRRVALRVVHGCKGLDLAATFGTATPVPYDQLEARARVELDAVLAPLRTAHPGVQVTINVSAAAALDALRAAARTGSLTVIGDHGHGHRAVHSGSLTHHLLHRPLTPLLVVPTGRTQFHRFETSEATEVPVTAGVTESSRR